MPCSDWGRNARPMPDVDRPLAPVRGCPSAWDLHARCARPCPASPSPSWPGPADLRTGAAAEGAIPGSARVSRVVESRR
jgi:hypothetical protein